MGLPGSGKSYLADYLNKKILFTTLSGEKYYSCNFWNRKCVSGQYKEAYEVLRIIAKELLVKNLALL